MAGRAWLDMVRSLVHYRIMKRINTHDAKANLSSYLKKLRRGERIIVCRRNVPIAEIRPLESEEPVQRAIGLAKGELSIPEAFFEPLPDAVLAGFEGQGERP